jgi:hemerythrin-like domain-containing protein
MLPIASLMIEHRLIERMIRVVSCEAARIKKEKNVNAVFIDTFVDFMRNFADKLHHGKEEDILFRECAAKKMSPEHTKMLKNLLDEHVIGRKTIGDLVAAKEKYVKGDTSASTEVVAKLEKLADMYPKHIEKEDKHFFIEVMEYFSQAEKDEMLKESNEFDRNFMNKKYGSIVDDLEGK